MRPIPFNSTLWVLIQLSAASIALAQAPYDSQLRRAQTGGASLHAPAAAGSSDAAWTAAPIQSQSRVQSAAAPAVMQANFEAQQPSLANPPTDAPVKATLNTPGITQATQAIQATQAPQPVQAQPRALKPPTDDDAALRSQSTSTWGMLVSVGSSLSIVIALILGAGWVYRKATPHAGAALPKQVLQVLGRTPLSARQHLVLLRFGSKLVLVSNLQGEVRTISEITDPLEVDQLAGACASVQPGSISESFRSVLNQIGSNGG